MKIEIPHPCPANWEQMNIGAIGRHCQECEKTVVDFTKMSREEIVLFLLLNQGNSVCGRFRKNQLDYYHLEEMITIQQLRNMPPKKAALLLSLACAVLAGCQNSAPNSAQTPRTHPAEITASANKNTVNAIDTLAADSSKAISNQPKVNPPKKDSIFEVIEVGMIEMGEVIAEPYPWDTTDVSEPLLVTTSGDTSIYQIAEHMPEFPGGLDSLFSFIDKTLQSPKTYHYAVGKIYIRFIVEKDGSVTHPEVLRSTLGAAEFDNEALKVIAKMPKWLPGKIGEKPVRTYYTLPITFN